MRFLSSRITCLKTSKTHKTYLLCTLPKWNIRESKPYSAPAESEFAYSAERKKSHFSPPTKTNGRAYGNHKKSASLRSFDVDDKEPRINLTTLKLKTKMNLTVGVLSRHRVVLRVQVWVCWVKIRWRFRISVRSGRVGISSWDAWPVFSIGAVLEFAGRYRYFGAKLWIYVQFWVIQSTFGYPIHFRWKSDFRSSGLARSDGFDPPNRNRPVCPPRNTRAWPKVPDMIQILL